MSEIFEFDEKWYLKNYPDVLLGKWSAYEHFVKYGKQLGRSPSKRHFEKTLRNASFEMTKGSESTSFGELNDHVFLSKRVSVPNDLTKFKERPAVLPNEIVLPDLKGPGNNYDFLLNRVKEEKDLPVTIVVLNYNRRSPLINTLTGICNQNYDLDKIEVVITDDGSSESVFDVIQEYSKLINIKYCWHRDVGFTAAAARNNGIALGSNDFTILLDVDMYPDPDLVKSYVAYSTIAESAILFGPRKYLKLEDVECDNLKLDPLLIRSLPEVVTNNSVAGRIEGKKSVDWRLETIYKTNFLKNEKMPFRMIAAGNIAFSKAVFNEVGGFDARFNNWGYEDGELGFRFFNNGKYIIPIMQALAYHQEPKGGVNETDRSGGKKKSAGHYGDVCPYYRHLIKKKKVYKVPTVSIYIPAFNAENTISDAVDSVLRQSYTDIEVCVCDDGSTDNTLKVLEEKYSDDERVKWISQENKGIGGASNSAIRLCKGIYIGQLDSDDILAVDAVEQCIPHFEKDPYVGMVYTTYENQHPDGKITPGYNYPVFTREKLITGMIAHHFRMFRRRDWAKTAGFDETIKNAVDYDFYLKLSEVCEVVHLNVIAYRRRLHGGNTSLKYYKEQNINAMNAVNGALERQGLKPVCYLERENSSKLSFNGL